MMKLIFVLAGLCAIAYAAPGGGHYAVDYGFTAGGYGGGYGHGGGHGHGHAQVMAHQNPHHYKFSVKDGHSYHTQTADAGYGHGGYGHGGGY